MHFSSVFNVNCYRGQFVLSGNGSKVFAEPSQSFPKLLVVGRVHQLRLTYPPTICCNARTSEQVVLGGGQVVCDSAEGIKSYCRLQELFSSTCVAQASPNSQTLPAYGSEVRANSPPK